jgi:hypothetical protein
MPKTMMLMLSALCLAAPYTTLAESPNTVPVTDVMRPRNTQQPRDLTQPRQADVLAAQAMHFAIQGRTATWSFRFRCAGSHCSFRNYHHPRDPENMGYVAIATSFDQAPTVDTARAPGVTKGSKVSRPH